MWFVEMTLQMHPLLWQPSDQATMGTPVTKFPTTVISQSAVALIPCWLLIGCFSWHLRWILRFDLSSALPQQYYCPHLRLLHQIHVCCLVGYSLRVFGLAGVGATRTLVPRHWLIHPNDSLLCQLCHLPAFPSSVQIGGGSLTQVHPLPDAPTSSAGSLGSPQRDCNVFPLC